MQIDRSFGFAVPYLSLFENGPWPVFASRRRAYLLASPVNCLGYALARSNGIPL
jgi:hypothetical protein